MKPYSSLKSVLSEFLNLHRTLVSEDMDKTHDIIGTYMSDSVNYTTENYAPLSFSAATAFGWTGARIGI